MSLGCAPSVTASFVMMHSVIVSSEGIVNMTSIMTFSMIERSPRAPVLRSTASFAIAETASCSKVSRTSSKPNSFWYCLISALRGLVRIFTSASSSSPSRETTTGTRPMNSGIRPNFTRSSGMTSFRRDPTSSSRRSFTFAPKPIAR